MRYLITYYDRRAFRKTKEERTKTLELTNFDTLSEAIDLLQKNEYLIISAELVEETYTKGDSE